jgi:hypothetical protein
MADPVKTPSATSDVLHSQQHTRLSTAEIAKAVARHKRDHPERNPRVAHKPPSGKAPAR